VYTLGISKIRITVRNVKTGNEWTEDYDKVGIGDNGNLLQAEDWAFQLVKWFNDALRPEESPRELLKTELIGASTAHDWYKRTNGMSVQFRGQLVDVFECRKCGVTGKKFRLDSVDVRRDAKFKAKKYDVCNPTHK
jgi:hypothetical protein